MLNVTACAAAVCILVGTGAACATIMTFETWTQNNAGVENIYTPDTELSVGSRVDSSIVTYLSLNQTPFDLMFEEGNGWTPNVVITWPWGDNGTWGSDSEYDTYLNWEGRGSVVQAEIVYDADNQLDLVFTPDVGFGVRLNSFVLDEYTGGGEITIEWQVLDAGGVLASDTILLVEGGRITIDTGVTTDQVTLGEAVTLRLSNANLTGEPWFVAVDDINFDQVSDDPGCEGDLDGDGDVDQADLGTLLGAWGAGDGGDLDGDGDTDQADLGVLLGDWGCGG